MDFGQREEVNINSILSVNNAIGRDCICQVINIHQILTADSVSLTRGHGATSLTRLTKALTLIK